MNEYMNDKPNERMRLSYEDGKTALARMDGPQIDRGTPGLLLSEAAHLGERTEAERSMLAVHTDPSLSSAHAESAAQRVRRGASWVRPTELVARTGARAAGRGIDFQAELARRIRGGTTQAISERARKLPDLSLFGRDYPSTEAAPAARPELGFR